MISVSGCNLGRDQELRRQQAVPSRDPADQCCCWEAGHLGRKAAARALGVGELFPPWAESLSDLSATSLQCLCGNVHKRSE